MRVFACFHFFLRIFAEFSRKFARKVHEEPHGVGVRFFFGYNKELELQYRGRLRELKNLVPVRDGESDLFKAMKQISETSKGPEKQTPSAGCSIKWKNN